MPRLLLRSYQVAPTVSIPAPTGGWASAGQYLTNTQVRLPPRFAVASHSPVTLASCRRQVDAAAPAHHPMLLQCADWGQAITQAKQYAYPTTSGFVASPLSSLLNSTM